MYWDDDYLFLPDKDFLAVHKYTQLPKNSDYVLHNHDDVYEIVLLMSENCEFVVEGNTYKVAPHDIVFTRPFELHRIVCSANCPYERIILYIKSAYFTRHSCERFLDVFRNRGLGTGNVVSRDIIGGSAEDCMRRILSYYEKGEYEVAESVITEFLYLLNNAKAVSDNFYTKDERIRDIILYINRHLTDDLRLDKLAEKFFIDKFYLCKRFKKSTGYTVNRYINYKRILLAQELRREGKSVTDAGLEAGFNSYSQFYRTYVKQIGKPPRTM